MASDLFNSCSGFENSNIDKGANPPFDNFIPPVFFQAFTDYFSAKTETYKFSNPILYGGFFTDQLLGKKPKDYDVYISCPELVRAAREIVNRKYFSYKDSRQAEEDLESLMARNFNFANQRQCFGGLRNDPASNDGFSIIGAFPFEDDVFTVDLKVGTLDLSLKHLSSLTPAPALSAAMRIENGAPQFAYHRDFREHVLAGVMCNDKKHPDLLARLAESRGFRVVSAAEWSARRLEL